MSVVTHLESLNKKHSVLKEQIREYQSHHLSDNKVTYLKKQKLKLKDEISYFRKIANQNYVA